MIKENIKSVALLATLSLQEATVRECHRVLMRIRGITRCQGKWKVKH